MKKVFIFITVMFALLLNVYLIFYWYPEEKNSNKEEISKETVSYTQSIYKVDKNDILKQLQTEDKKNFESILGKLSAFDLGKIKEYVQDSDEQKGIKNIFVLLKKRLTNEDYEKIKEISSKFLDMDAVDQLLKNNYV